LDPRRRRSFCPRRNPHFCCLAASVVRATLFACTICTTCTTLHSFPMELWEVVGGTARGGIVVRMGRALESEQLPQRLSTGALVKELALNASRLHYELVTGDGPPSGWVSVRASQKELLQRRGVWSGHGSSSSSSPRQAQLQAAEATTSSSSTAAGYSGSARCVQTDAVERCRKDVKSQEICKQVCERIVRCMTRGGQPSVPECGCKPVHDFRHVCVFGPHHSCTGALMRELPRLFDVTLLNTHYDDNPELWKHTVFERQPRVPDGTFFVCLVKEPAFWIQSLGRDPSAGTFYEIQPVQCIPMKNGQHHIIDLTPRCTAQLFDHIVFDGMVYPDALALWEATTRAYLDEQVLPAWRTAVVRCEDFMFNFGEVMAALVARGLPQRDLQAFPCDWEPLESTAKDQTHPQCTRRARTELLRYYEDPRNRFASLTPGQSARLRKLAPDVQRRLCYGDEALASWLPVREA